jgi:3-methyladenine DNA glycosylase AlkD
MPEPVRAGLLTRVRAALQAVADPERAPAMQAYMRSSLPFHGVGTPLLRATCRRVFAGLAWPRAAAFRRDVLAVWRGARYREERYAAIELSGHRAGRDFQDMAALGMYEEMIVSGAWWDFVDALATRRLAELLRRHPGPMRRAMLEWSRGDDLWKRRAAILCQLGAKRETDLELLYACLAPSLASREFFLRKAIGWALRQYARVDAAEVRRYVQAHAHELSALSRREALRHVAPERGPARGRARADA